MIMLGSAGVAIHDMISKRPGLDRDFTVWDI